jgi:hypothetical protein
VEEVVEMLNNLLLIYLEAQAVEVLDTGVMQLLVVLQLKEIQVAQLVMAITVEMALQITQYQVEVVVLVA